MKDGSIIPGSVEHSLAVYSLASIVPTDQSTKKPPVDKTSSHPSPVVPAPRKQHPEGSMSSLLQKKNVPENVLNVINSFYRSGKKIISIAPKKEGYIHGFTSPEPGQTPSLHVELCGICDAIRTNGKNLNHHDLILAVSAHCKGFNVSLAQTISSVVSTEVARREDHRNASRKLRAAKKKRSEDPDQLMEQL